jgi:hypothetical protein
LNALSLPSIEEAEAWASEILARHSGSDYMFDPQGIGRKPTLTAESNTNDTPTDWQWHCAVRKIEIAVWPNMEFVTIFEDPERHWQTHFRGRHDFYLDVPLTTPFMMRVEGVSVQEGVYPKYCLIAADPDGVPFALDHLEPDYEGLTREEVELLFQRLGREPREFHRYHNGGKPGMFEQMLQVA